MNLKNLLLVSGTGRNSGKTTFACRVIEQFSDYEITSIKISPHFHSGSGRLVSLFRGEGFEIFDEMSKDTGKDSSRMFRSGAGRSIYIQADEKNVKDSFAMAYSLISPGKPVICESPALISYIEPGLFVIMRSPGRNLKNIEASEKFPHLTFSYDELLEIPSLPIDFVSGCWQITG